MKCPYCNQEMQRGKLASNGSRMDWYNEGQSAWKPTMNLVGVSLKSLLSQSSINGFLCPKCRKIVINLSGY